jgi:hypothetical protein
MSYFKLFLLALYLAMPALQAQDRVIPSQEMVLVPVTPSFKQINIVLEGTEVEQAFLQQVHAMLLEMLNRATLKVDKILVPDSMTYTPIPQPAAVSRRIVLKLDSDVARPPMKVGIAVEDMDKPEDDRVVKVYFYDPDNPGTFKEALRDYLSWTLGLNIPPERMPAYPAPSYSTPSPPPAKSLDDARIRPEPVIPSQEYIHRGGGHTSYTDLRITLEGTEEEDSALSELERMVREMLAKAYPRSGGEALAQRRIHIAARWADDAPVVRVRVTLDGAGAAPRGADFIFDPEQPAVLQEQLRQYLAQSLDAVIPP